MALSIEAKKAKKEGFVNLRYAYSKGTRCYFSTGITIPKADFQTKLEKPVRSSNDNAAYLNRQAAEVYNRINTISTKLYREGIDPVAELVHLHFYRLEKPAEAVKVESTLVCAFKRFLLAENYNAETQKIYYHLYDNLIACFGDRDMGGFAIEDWQKFFNYLKGKGLAANTICIRLTKFKHFLAVLRKEGVDINISKFPMPKEEIKKVSFTRESLQKIRDFKTSDESLMLARKMCLFQCYTGLRISDLLRLEPNHLTQQGGLYQISMESFKTNRKMFIPLTTEVLNIFRDWGHKAPQMTEQHYNRLLKVLVKEASIEQEVEWEAYDHAGRKIRQRDKLYNLVSSHACGRTAISYFMANYEPRDVCAILGKSMQTILKYYYANATENDILEKQSKIEAQFKGLRVA